MISVVIPAHNEADVIRRCLAAILSDAAPGELEIIVACNGCTDQTANIAREFGPPVKVVETAAASKTIALNLGDEAATGFPRLYVDADITLTVSTIRKVAAVLNDGSVLAAAPAAHFDLSECSHMVKSYYAIWMQLPYLHSGMTGSGVYALSKAGRARFTAFPNVIADDAFVRFQFSRSERLTVPDCKSVVLPPRTIHGVIVTKTRSHFGNRELRARFPSLQYPTGGEGHYRGLARLALNPRNWFGLCVYVYVKLATRKRALAQERRGDFQKWERDDTSRIPGGEFNRIMTDPSR